MELKGISDAGIRRLEARCGRRLHANGLYVIMAETGEFWSGSTWVQEPGACEYYSNQASLPSSLPAGDSGMALIEDEAGNMHGIYYALEGDAQNAYERWVSAE